MWGLATAYLPQKYTIGLLWDPCTAISKPILQAKGLMFALTVLMEKYREGRKEHTSSAIKYMFITVLVFVMVMHVSF